MKIKTSSIQYKIVDALFTPSKNLCIYFWQCIASWAMVLFCIALAIGLFVFPYAMLYHPDIENAGVWTRVFMFFGIFPWGVIGAVLFVAGFMGVEKVFKAIFGGRSVAGEYIKAKKEEICPKIEFEE